MSGQVPGSAVAISFAKRAELYARAVVGGDQVACRWVKAACQRHLDDLQRAESDPDWPWVFDEQRAGRPCHFIQCLPHIEGKWARPVIVDGRQVRQCITLEPWQIFTVAVPFGWVHRDTGLRRFRRVYLEVARKNAKSTLAAGIALYLLCADGEPGAQVYSAATKKDQAKIVWNVAREMVRLESEFRAMPPNGLGVSFNLSAISQLHTTSRYQPLGRDSGTLDGLNTHGFVSDELHAQTDRKLYDVIDSSTGAREQPMGWGITTAGYDTGGVCYEQREYMIGILNAVLLRHEGMGYQVKGDSFDDESYFGLIFTLDDGYQDVDDEAVPDDEWSEEANWIKANPNLGVSASIEDMRSKCQKALRSSGSRAEFRTKHCCQWLASAAMWMDMVRWDRCADRSLKESDFDGDPVWLGIDAAFKTDIFALIKLFRHDDEYYAFGRYWFPEEKARQREYQKIAGWADEGLITLSPGEVIDIEAVRDEVKRCSGVHELRECAYDPAMLTQFATEMVEERYPMVEIGQTAARFSEPMKTLEELVLQGQLHHNGDPVLRWMISNVAVRHWRGLIQPVKPSGQEDRKKIDGVIALLMALGRAMCSTGSRSIEQGFVT